MGIAPGHLSANPAHGETSPPVRGCKTHVHAICTASRCKERRKEEINKKTLKYDEVSIY
jgi:hypothetical protein